MDSLNLNDLKSIIRDGVRAEVANAMVEATEKAKETADRAKREGTEAQLIQRAIDADAGPRANVDRHSLQVLHDPLKGKGLGFARAVKALAVGILDRRDPKDVANAWAKQGHKEYAGIADSLDAQNRAFLMGNAAQGGSLVPPEQAAEVIELLYAVTVALAMGARTMEFNGSISLGKMNSGATIGYTGEAGLMVPSQPGTGELRLSGKKAYGLVPLSNEMLRNPAVGADAIVRDDLVRGLALRRDLSFYRGTGNSYQPKGMKLWLNAANSFAMTGSPTAATKIADLVKAIRLVDSADVPLTEAAGFVFHPRTKWALFSTVDANSNLVFAAMLATGSLFGFKARATTQIPINLGGGSESEVYFGAHDDAIVGFDQATPMQVEAFPNGAFHDGSAVVSGISTDQSPIRILEGHDMVLRHDLAFSMITGVTWT